jgi:hypothetical protein
MPIEDLQQLLHAVRDMIVADGQRFELAPGALQSPSIEALVLESFPLTGGKWVLRAPSEPRISGDAVVMSGTMELFLGVSSAMLQLGFDLQDAGAPSLLVELAPLDQPIPPSSWNLGSAYPVWAEQRSVLTQLEFQEPSFWFSSIVRPAAESRPSLAVGRTFFAPDLPLSGVLAPLQVLPGLSLSALEGQITGSSAAPHTTIAARPIRPIPIEGLDLPLSFAAVSAAPSSGGKIQQPAPPVETYLRLSSSVQVLAPPAPPMPISVTFGGLSAVIPLRADLQEISQYGMRELESFVRGAPIGSYLDSVFEIGRTVALTDLAVFVGIEPLSLAAIALGLGTTRPLTIVEHWVELPAVHVDFMVNDPAGSASITAVLTGTFDFLEGIPVLVSATFPQMLFVGSVQSEPPLPLARIVQRFIPSVTSFPEISLTELYLAADFTQHRYAFQLAVQSGWKIPIGIARFELEEASVALGYAADAGVGFTGELSAMAVLFDQHDTEVARLYAEWKLPGANFVLEGTFPEISLTELATTLTGGAVPNSAGLPAIELRDSLIRLRMTQGAERPARLLDTGAERQERPQGTTAYRFDLATTIDAEGIGQASLAFETRRATDGVTGFAAGIVVQPQWKPDALWSGLQGVMKLLSVRDAGLILSSIEDQQFTLPNLDHLAYVPRQIEPGVTFFGAVELTGEVFSLLTELFDGPVELDLYAHVDPSAIANSEIRARLGASAGRNAVSFTGLEIEMKPGSGHFSLTAGATFSMYGERLTLAGEGTIELSPPASASFAIRVSEWVRPFGIDGLTIRTFGLSVDLDELGLGVGVLGDFVIGADPASQFEFLVGGDVKDFEAPDAFVCSLKSVSERPLKVTDLVVQYTRLDLSEVPLLNGLAFTRLEFYVVADPSGWTAPDGHHYEAGIGIDADLTLYEWELVLKLEVGEKRGILAEGSLSQPVEVLDLLKISDAAGSTGPSLKIDTSALLGIPPTSRVNEILARRARPLTPGVLPAVMPLNPYVTLSAALASEKVYFSASGAVRVLGLSESFSGSITSDGFEVNFHAELADLFRAEFMAAFAKSSGFQGAARGGFDLDLDFPTGVSIDGWTLLPPLAIQASATLDVEVVLKLSEQRVALALDFWWAKTHFNPGFSLDAKAIPEVLGELWEQIVKWIRDNEKAFFAELLADVEKWIAALKEGLIWAGQSALEIAEALYHLFGVDGIGRMAELLVEVGRLSFTGMVEALMDVLEVSFEEAVAALRGAGEECAVASNEATIYTTRTGRLGDE